MCRQQAAQIVLHCHLLCPSQAELSKEARATAALLARAEMLVRAKEVSGGQAQQVADVHGGRNVVLSSMRVTHHIFAVTSTWNKLRYDRQVYFADVLQHELLPPCCLTYPFSHSLTCRRVRMIPP
jgi:hypothetical protein